MMHELLNFDRRRLSQLTGVIATLPLLVSLLMGSTARDSPPLDRTGTPNHPLQFARYCFNHGREPVLHTSRLTSRFQFRNVGTEAIRLGQIERSCGCLTPELSHSKLAPGEIGWMNVSVSLAEQSAGFHEFQLTVHYNDPQPRHETVLIKAVFPEPQIQVEPRAMVVSQRAPADRPITHQFKITDHRPQPMRVMSVESSSPWTLPSIMSVDDGGRATRIAVEIRGGIPTGTHHVLVHAMTNDPEFPAAVMPILIQGPERSQSASVFPERLRIHADSTTAQAIRMHIPADWQISHVECFPPELLCEWQCTEGAASAVQQQVDLALMMSAPPASRTREGVVTLYANDSTQMVTASIEILGGSQQLTPEVANAGSAGQFRANQE